MYVTTFLNTRYAILQLALRVSHWPIIVKKLANFFSQNFVSFVDLVISYQLLQLKDKVHNSVAKSISIHINLSLKLFERTILQFKYNTVIILYLFLYLWRRLSDSVSVCLNALAHILKIQSWNFAGRLPGTSRRGVSNFVGAPGVGGWGIRVLIFLKLQIFTQFLGYRAETWYGGYWFDGTHRIRVGVNFSTVLHEPRQ